jgi:hypothetical protein
MSPQCVTCKGDGYQEDEDGEFIHRISEGETCDSCGRPHGFEKIKISYSVVNESGNRERRHKTVDYQGDTPMEAINSVLSDHDGPRGERVVEIHEIEVNRTPPLKEEELGERSVQYENAGIIAHKFTFEVER